MNIIYHQHTTDFYRDKNTHNAYLSGTDGLPLIRFHCFDDEPWMNAAFSTRLGGVSTGHLSSLNLGLDRGDEPRNISENYKRITVALNVAGETLVKTDQVHKTLVEYADKSILPASYKVRRFPETDGLYTDIPGKSILPAGYKVRRFPETDGLYTDIPGITLCISAADCVPVFIADPVTRQIALVHSGWKGTVGEISVNAAKKLVEKGANPSDLKVLIGPSISMENYEVSSDVAYKFKSKYPADRISDILMQTDDEHYQLDLWAACYHSLALFGVNPNNIYFSGVCTFENHDLLFSHRYTKGMRGNQSGFMVIRG